MGKRLVLFDFDGTITYKDTFPEFIAFTNGRTYMISVFILFSPLLLLMKLKLYNNDRLKQQVLSFVYKGKDKTILMNWGVAFYEACFDRLVRPMAINEIAKYAESDRFMVTASLDVWVKPFADRLGLSLISTKAKYVNDKFTGAFDGPNCNYEEKANYIRKAVDLTQYKEIIAYGDSKGDKAMFNLSTQYFYKPFRQV
jgi:HAD superfamily phosphoserine phosphatase-like hydrolase